MMGLEGTTALFLVFLCFFQFSPFFFHPRFSDYVSWAPLRSDDKQNFHVLCIINPSLPLFMPTLPLSRAHAWIAKESSLQLELIDIPEEKKKERGREKKTGNPQI